MVIPPSRVWAGDFEAAWGFATIVDERGPPRRIWSTF